VFPLYESKVKHPAREQSFIKIHSAARYLTHKRSQLTIGILDMGCVKARDRLARLASTVSCVVIWKTFSI